MHRRHEPRLVRVERNLFRVEPDAHQRRLHRDCHKRGARMGRPPRDSRRLGTQRVGRLDTGLALSDAPRRAHLFERLELQPRQPGPIGPERRRRARAGRPNQREEGDVPTGVSDVFGFAVTPSNPELSPAQNFSLSGGQSKPLSLLPTTGPGGLGGSYTLAETPNVLLDNDLVSRRHQRNGDLVVELDVGRDVTHRGPACELHVHEHGSAGDDHGRQAHGSGRVDRCVRLQWRSGGVWTPSDHGRRAPTPSRARCRRAASPRPSRTRARTGL